MHDAPPCHLAASPANPLDVYLSALGRRSPAIPPSPPPLPSSLKMHSPCGTVSTPLCSLQLYRPFPPRPCCLVSAAPAPSISSWPSPCPCSQIFLPLQRCRPPLRSAPLSMLCLSPSDLCCAFCRSEVSIGQHAPLPHPPPFMPFDTATFKAERPGQPRMLAPSTGVLCRWHP